MSKNLSYCKLYTNFAVVFNKIKITIMNTEKLKQLSQTSRSDLFWSLCIIKALNKKYKFLSWSETRQLEIQINQIKKCYDNLKSTL